MRRTNYPATWLLLTMFIAATASAQDFFVYPAKGQTQAQQDKDEAECFTWARRSTGFDPMQSPQATTLPPQQGAPQGGVLAGGARGAALGAIGGAIAGDAGKGAAIGAATGGLFGGMRRQDQRRREEQERQQWEQQQAAQYAQQRDGYNRAYTACLEGRGYTVK